MKVDPLTGRPCGCKRGLERENCPNCEGTGKAIDWAAFHARNVCKECGIPLARCEHKPTCSRYPVGGYKL